MEIVGVIPARYKSKRLPGKPLILIEGRPLIKWTYKNALRSEMLSRIVVATDDRRIFSAVQKFGGQAIITSSDCKSGTDRVAEVASKIRGDIFINIQGDEPVIHPSVIDAIARTLVRKKMFPVATAAVPIRDLRDLKDMNVVKVVTDAKNIAHYFSRSMIPFPRDISDLGIGIKRKIFLKHLGVYGYSKKFLKKFLGLKESINEKIEKLEQLRTLDHGYRIYVVTTRFDSIGVDTLQDIERVRRLLRKRKDIV